MTPNLTSGDFKIVSLTEGHPPTSVDFSRTGQQFVRLDQPIRNWVLKKQGDKFRLSIGGYKYTGVVGDKVIASINREQRVEWHATYIENYDAYTIQPDYDHNKGWTVSHEAEGSEIEIKLLIRQPSEPPRYLLTQLFRLVPVH